MNGQGSFWSAFGVRFGSASGAIDEILEKDGHTLEELLDHDDIIQECKYMNAGLIENLAQRDVVEKLIRYVIMKPPGHAPDSKEAKEGVSPSPVTDSKYPYICSELFACEVMSMLDVMFEHSDLLELLFSFLDRTPPLDPSCAGYFRKVVVVLIQRKYDQLVKFLQGRGIVAKLVEHIGLYSIMELLIMIGWDDGLGQVNDVTWLYKEKLIPMLVAKLDPVFEKDEEVHVNAARALVDVVVKCPPATSSLLVTHLQTPEMLTALFTYMFSGSLSSLNNCMSVAIVLVQRDANRRAEFPYDKSDPSMPLIFDLIQKHLATLIALLTTPPRPVEMKTQFGSLSPPFGETRMKVVELLLVLVRSNYPKMNDELAKLAALSPVLDCFLAFPWNNMLHGLVESILRTILDSDSDSLKKGLFEAKLVDKFILGDNMTKEALAKSKGVRLGYMGHLVRMANALVAAHEKDSQIRTFMGEDTKAWLEFVGGPLARENERLSTVLGGHRPSSPFRPPDATDPSTTTSSSSSSLSSETGDVTTEGSDTSSAPSTTGSAPSETPSTETEPFSFQAEDNDGGDFDDDVTH